MRVRVVSRDERFMRLAVNLAKRGAGRVSPNPLVGAVLVKDDRVIGKGYHRAYGLDHAEVEAIRSASEDVKDSTLYVNLEPCDHFGKTPPCTTAILQSGIRRVVVGMEDPNPVVSGRGIKRLRDGGISVDVGVLEGECRRLNEAYIKFVTTRTPFVILKMALTLDGRIADPSGGSRWISSERSRRMVHRLRGRVDAVMVGVGTILRDDPLLTVRLVKGRNPKRIIVDSHLTTPLKARVISQGDPPWIVTTYKAPLKRVDEMRKAGVEVIFLPYREEGVDIRALIDLLGEREITSLMIEGGARLATSALKEGVVDKILFFYSPRILGGEARPVFHDLGIASLEEAVRVRDMRVRKVGRDLVVEGYLH